MGGVCESLSTSRLPRQEGAISPSCLSLTLVQDSVPGRFQLRCGAIEYMIEFLPEGDIALSDLLRRVRPVLVGGADPAGRLDPLVLLREVGTRLWRVLVPDSAPSTDGNALVRQLRDSAAPLCLILPPNVASLPWELLCDPERPGDTGFLARRRPIVRWVEGGIDLPVLQPPLRVLLLISSPPGLEEHRQVDVESERAAVEDATRTFRQDGLLQLSTTVAD